MEKAKIGDQRFKRPSRMPYIVAGLSLLFLIMGVLFVMSWILNPKWLRMEHEPTPLPTLTPIPTSTLIPTPTLDPQEIIQTQAEVLWKLATPLPSYLDIQVQYVSASDVQVCAVIFLDPNTRGSDSYKLERFVIDMVDYPGIGTQSDENERLAARVCETLPLTPGYHLVEIQGGGAIFYKGAIHVE